MHKHHSSGSYNFILSLSIRKRPVSFMLGDWIDPKAGLDTLAKRKISSFAGD
jgi:hypothetical protein